MNKSPLHVTSSEVQVWAQFSRASCDLRLPVYVVADGVFKSSHGRVLIQDLHAFLGSVEGVPICRGKRLHSWWLKNQQGSKSNMSNCFLLAAGSEGAATNLLTQTLDLGKTLRQLWQLLLSWCHHRWLPAIPKYQRTWRKVIILWPLQPDKVSHK